MTHNCPDCEEICWCNFDMDDEVRNTPSMREACEHCKDDREQTDYNDYDPSEFLSL